MESDEIDEALADRDDELSEAFARVRGRAQFTWRISSSARGLSAAARGAKADARIAAGAAGAMTGAEYLREAARSARPALPAAFRAVRDKLRPFVAADRYQAATPALPASLYHLVDRASIERYTGAAEKLASAIPSLRLSGPFPPFAFTPELL
jgi:hypothetical protein